MNHEFGPAEFEQLLRDDIAEWVEEFCENEFYELDDGSNDSVLGFDVRCVHSVGGFEGGGDHAERVFVVTKDGVDTEHFFKITGYYNSYEGTTWGEMAERVYPRQVMVTQYFDSPEA